MSKKALSYIEIDVPSFVATSPETTETWRFAKPTKYLPDSIDAISSIIEISFSPGRISLGGDLGLRSQLTIRFTDHPHIMATESFTSGTFWGKWRGRYGTKLRGKALRWIEGNTDQTLAAMETRHFVIDSVDGPTPDGVYIITAKDPLKLADNDRAQAPAVSKGYLQADITATDTQVTLLPSGIGSQYDASGYVNIGGEEIAQYMRSGDVLDFSLGTSPPTPDGRGALGTDAAAHSAEDKVQQVLRYSGEDPADIIYDLLVTYAGVDTDYIPLSSWLNETQNFLGRVYTATIADPTGIKDLVSELIEQAGLALWWADKDQLVKLQVLREVATTAATFNEDNTIEKTLRSKEQPEKRVSEVWVHYGQKNPLEKLSEFKNYRSVEIRSDADSENDYGSAAIKKIYSRWIPALGRATAQTLGDLLLSRFADPPRNFNFSTYRYAMNKPELGGGYQLGSTVFQDSDGSARTEPIQVTRITPKQDRFEVEAEEMLWDGTLLQDNTNRVIIIDSNINNVNGEDLHNSLYPVLTGSESPAVTVTFIVQAGVIVGSDDPSSPAFDMGDWPVGFSPHLEVLGRIEGAGGDGAMMTGTKGADGGDGGTALYTRHSITLDDSSGEIWGGGGGGATNQNFGACGGGGAGQIPGDGGASAYPPASGDPGTTEAGGAGGSPGGGDGGGPGEDGGNSPTHSGGSAGYSIDGVSHVTTTGSPVGDRRGSQVN